MRRVGWRKHRSAGAGDNWHPRDKIDVERSEDEDHGDRSAASAFFVHDAKLFDPTARLRLHWSLDQTGEVASLRGGKNPLKACFLLSEVAGISVITPSISFAIERRSVARRQKEIRLVLSLAGLLVSSQSEA
jgi:hypothetical protein